MNRFQMSEAIRRNSYFQIFPKHAESRSVSRHSYCDAQSMQTALLGRAHEPDEDDMMLCVPALLLLPPLPICPSSLMVSAQPKPLLR